VVLLESEAIEYALAQAQKGDLIVILPSDVTRSIELVNGHKEKLSPYGRPPATPAS